MDSEADFTGPIDPIRLQAGPFYPDEPDGPLFQDIVVPEVSPQSRYNPFVSSLVRNYGEDPESKKDIIHFLVSFRHQIIRSNGLKQGEDGSEILTSGAGNEQCFFLGTKVLMGVGCKVSGTPQKLKEFMKAMELLLLSYLHRIPTHLLSEFERDEEVFMQFTLAITTLIYFYGRKQMSMNIESFSPFFSAINKLFGREIFHITCEEKGSYICGRGITYGRCEKTGLYFIAIDQIQSTSNNNPSYSMNKRVKTVANACGGRRKTIRRRKPLRKRKTRR